MIFRKARAIPLINNILQGLDHLRSFGRAGHFGRGRLRAREKYRDDYCIVAASLLKQINFDSVLDVGCANGFLLLPLHKAGKRVQGIDLSPDLSDFLPAELLARVTIGDFEEVSGQYDLVCCVEVAEHIKPGRSDRLIEVLTECATKWIYFTAAPPGQLGRGHINLQPQRDWTARFHARGWQVDEVKTLDLKNDLRKVEQATWLAENSLILRPISLADGVVRRNGTH